ncbi:hypothetical protein VFPFJ_01862 [Purpureocillium lilacinum]|uniref:Uncharacterized protein n=1 Tax=Purpureocillium lilacinum TaxID=33203 RepID=A0A179HT14_PURLI|nr:hypothetical protein VFPFJ_01862 [Purpureocillium lilacinum]OAQ71633.1 hypothetical protein VFPBJ_10412 [Purpureocillium lilacinum]OAQ92701.1 hypothetical protein VFPFJ_01862 [Purpureocillium lilacinum]
MWPGGLARPLPTHPLRRCALSKPRDSSAKPSHLALCPSVPGARAYRDQKGLHMGERILPSRVLDVPSRGGLRWPRCMWRRTSALPLSIGARARAKGRADAVLECRRPRQVASVGHAHRDATTLAEFRPPSCRFFLGCAGWLAGCLVRWKTLARRASQTVRHWDEVNSGVCWGRRKRLDMARAEPNGFRFSSRRGGVGNQ